MCFVVFCSLQDHLRTGTSDLDHPVSCWCKNIDSWRARKEGLQHAFPLDRSDGSIIFNHHRNQRRAPNVCLENFEFVTDYFSGLSLSPRRGNEGAIFMAQLSGK
jgi:hypothetical protein